MIRRRHTFNINYMPVVRDCLFIIIIENSTHLLFKQNCVFLVRNWISIHKIKTNKIKNIYEHAKLFKDFVSRLL